MIQIYFKMTKISSTGYSTERTQRELLNEYKHDRVKVGFKNIRILVLWTKVTLALDRLKEMSVKTKQNSIFLLIMF